MGDAEMIPESTPEMGYCGRTERGESVLYRQLCAMQLLAFLESIDGPEDARDAAHDVFLSLTGMIEERRGNDACET